MKKSWIKRGTKKIKKRSSAPHSQQRRIADYMFLTYIILRDKVCFYCKAPAYTGHHIFPKVALHAHLRYDPVNLIGVCETHHGPWHGVHASPQMYEPSIKTAVDHKHGPGTYERLEARAYMSGSKSDLQLVELWLWQEFKEFEVFKPETWDGWKETPKINWLREVRKQQH